MSEKKIAHLQIVQSVIERLDKYTFVIKGWSLLYVTAMITFSERVVEKAWLVYVPVIILWFLDAYYLARAQLWTDFYDDIVETKKGGRVIKELQMKYTSTGDEKERKEDERQQRRIFQIKILHSLFRWKTLLFHIAIALALFMIIRSDKLIPSAMESFCQ